MTTQPPTVFRDLLEAITSEVGKSCKASNSAGVVAGQVVEFLARTYSLNLAQIPRDKHDVLEQVFAHVRNTLPVLKKQGHQQTLKAVARQVVDLLNVHFDLASSVVIEDFICADKPSEASKARSQLAIATQRAAALFALQAGLFETTLLELEKQIDITRKSQEALGYGAQFSEAFTKEILMPLQVQANKLREMQKNASSQREAAQKRFQELRQEATRPIMKQLQVSNKTYANLYKTINSSSLCDEVEKAKNAIHKIKDASVVEMKQKLISPSSSNSNDVDNSCTIEYLQALYKDAKQARIALQSVLGTVQKLCNDQEHVDVEVEMGGLKAVERSMEKTVEEYEGDFSRLLDLARGCLVCKTIDDAAAVMKVLRLIAQDNSKLDSAVGKLQIIRIKNRLDPMFRAAAESGGYRDVLVNLRMWGSHVCELQIQVESFLKVKAGGGHKMYSVARSLHLLDPELSQVRVSSTTLDKDIVRLDGTKVREQLDLALQRVDSGTCQGLHLNHFTVTVAESGAIRQALASSSSNVREISLLNCGLDVVKSAEMCTGIVQNIGDFLDVNLPGNKGISGDCVAMFVSEELERLNVQECGLDTNMFEKVSKAIVECKPYRLRELNLSGNVIGPTGARHLAQAFAVFTSSRITSLNLRGNEIGQAGVQHLAQALQASPTLMFLNLQDNHLGEEGSSKLIAVIATMTDLVQLDFEENAMGTGNNAELMINSLISNLAQCHKLSLLNLSNNGFSDISMKRLRAGLKHISEIKGVGQHYEATANPLLSYSNETPGSQIQIQKAVDFGSLKRDVEDGLSQQLILSDLKLSERECVLIRGMLIAPQSNVREVKFTRCGLNSEMSSILCQGVSGSFGNYRSVVLEDNKGISAECMNNFVSSGLELLRVRECGLSQFALQSIANTMKTRNTQLFELDLFGNELGPNGVETVAILLESMHNLSALDIGSNGIKLKGTEDIAKVLSTKSSMVSLNIANNAIGAEGVRHLMNAVGARPNYQTLCLKDNEFGAEGANYLQLVLKKLDKLTSLDISGNNIGNKAAQEMIPFLTSLSHLKSLDVSNNAIDDPALISDMIQSFVGRGVWLGCGHSGPVKLWSCTSPRSTSLTALSTQLNLWDVNVIGCLLHEIKELDLSGCNMGQDKLKALLSAHELAGFNELKLEKLIISGNKLGNDNQILFPTLKLPHLKSVDISHNSIDDPALISNMIQFFVGRGIFLGCDQSEPVKKWASTFPRSTTLTAHNTQLSLWDMNVIGCLLSGIKELDLSGCNMGPNNLQTLLSAHEVTGFKELKLERLSLSGNRLGNDHQNLLPTLKMPHLKSFDISNNSIDDPALISSMVQSFVGRGIWLGCDHSGPVKQWTCTTPRSTTLTAHNTQLSLWDVNVIGCLLHEIKELDLSGCNMGPDNLNKVLQVSFSTTDNKQFVLEKLVLSGNKLGNEAIQDLLPVLTRFPPLQVVDIAKNSVDNPTVIANVVCSLASRGVLLVSEESNAIKDWLKTPHRSAVLNLRNAQLNRWDMNAVGCSLHWLKELDLSQCGIGKQDLEVIMNAHSKMGNDRVMLENLNLSGNRIDNDAIQMVFDKLLATLAQLKTLDLSCNPFNDGMIVLELVSWCNLHNVSLQGNKLLGGSFVLRLRDGPQTATFFASVGGVLHELKELDMRGCVVDEQHIQTLIQGYQGAKQKPLRLEILRVEKLKAASLFMILNFTALISGLGTLHLASCDIDEVKSISLAKVLLCTMQLRDLNLDFNPIGPAGMKALAPSIKQLTSLTIISFVGTNMGLKGASTVAAALSKAKLLESVNIKANEIGHYGAKEFATMLKGKKFINLLNFNGSMIEIKGAAKLGPALHGMTNMTSLDLGENKVKAGGAKFLAPALTRMTHMTNLNLGGNEIGPKGAKDLAPALTMMTHMTNLNLDANSLGPAGAVHLAPALTTMTSMTNLNLADNELGPEGAEYLVPGLTMMTSMTNLNLAVNELGPAGAEYLAPALTMMTSMSNLNLAANELGPAGAEYLAPALTMMTSMSNLNLAANELGPAGAEYLVPALTMMTSMSNLNLDDDDTDSWSGQYVLIKYLEISYLLRNRK